MRKDIKAYIEAELRDYHENKKDIELLREEILEGTSVGDESGIRGTSISNVTQNKALRLITNKRLRKLEETIRAIDNVILELDEDKYKLVELKYWTRPNYYNDTGIAHQLNIGMRTYYRWKDAIILAIAQEMGLTERLAK